MKKLDIQFKNNTPLPEEDLNAMVGAINGTIDEMGSKNILPMPIPVYQYLIATNGFKKGVAHIIGTYAVEGEMTTAQILEWIANHYTNS